MFFLLKFIQFNRSKFHGGFISINHLFKSQTKLISVQLNQFLFNIILQKSWLSHFL